MNVKRKHGIFIMVFRSLLAKAFIWGIKVNIACQLYDYIEIACMYKLEVSVFLKSGEMMSGQALTTLIDKKENVATECIQMKINNAKHNVALHEIAELHAITDNPHFSSVSF